MVSTWICAFLCICAAVFGLALGMVITCLMVVTKEENGKDEKDGKSKKRTLSEREKSR